MKTRDVLCDFDCWMCHGTASTDLFDELRGAVVDLPVGTILPNWVQKSAVIQMIDRIEAERRTAEPAADVR